MTSQKNTAEELVSKFRKYANGNDDDRFSPAIEKQNAKKCALIAVDEILSVFGVNVNNEYWIESLITYWQEVKQEIEKL